MATPAEIAAWMLDECSRHGTVYQETIAFDIERKFGKEFVPVNDNGNPAIRKDVLAAFRAISTDSIVWMRGEKAWRKRERGDEPGRKQD